MQKILTMLAALTIVGGLALAQNEGNSEGKGVQCQVNVGGTPEAENPAEAFEQLERLGYEEPVDVVAASPAAGNLGQLLQVHCSTPADE